MSMSDIYFSHTLRMFVQHTAKKEKKCQKNHQCGCPEFHSDTKDRREVVSFSD